MVRTVTDQFAPDPTPRRRFLRGGQRLGSGGFRRGRFNDVAF